ncbi:MAG: helix-turn-helix transcriptional regulator [Candidatus Caenarcaniphilales bacterium]|nr:helix-turn-helix transcriptional regulator [Candidatus Caenarcaniphilales bacterium]
MKFRDSLNTVFEAFSVSAIDVAERANVGADQISKFRRGHKDLNSSTLERIVEALPPSAKTYFYFLMASNSDESKPAA